jgi:hypothetical protein
VPGPDHDFFTNRDARFYADGKPWRFGGTNAYYLHRPASLGPPPASARQTTTSHPLSAQVRDTTMSNVLANRGRSISFSLRPGQESPWF